MDIRQNISIRHGDVAALDFIRDPAKYVFRKHFNQGLRSHVIEVLDPVAVRREQKGEIKNGLRRYPRAVPRRMLRIFKSRFRSLEQAQEEISRIKVLEKYLPRDTYAKSEEFIVSFSSDDTAPIGLCGLQEYVDGQILDPWSLSHVEPMGNIRTFIQCLKKMALAEQMIPDLAGIGNLKIDSSNRIRLVDINNISRIHYSPAIRLDDNGYPACDKSVEVLFRLEKRFVRADLPITDNPLYQFFLSSRRMETASAREKAFYARLSQEK